MQNIEIITDQTILTFLFETKTSQTELIKRAGIGNKTLYNVLYCKHRPSLVTQSKLYNAMKQIRKEQRKKKSGN